jgi:dihydrofolate reductase
MSGDGVTSLPITAIVAADAHDGIALADGRLPWCLPPDLARFKRLTVGVGRSAVLMGRATWDTLEPRYQPLPKRKNIVLTRNEDAVFAGATRVGGWEEALAAAEGADHLWVVGGAQVYALALARPETRAIELTRIDRDYRCEIRWPGVPAGFALTWREAREHEGVAFAFERWERKLDQGTMTSAQTP